MKLFFAVCAVMIAVVAVVPLRTFAADGHDLEISGWMPYWRDTESIKDAKKHIKQIDVVYPFAFSVQQDGSIKDLADLGEKQWQSFIKTARAKDIPIIPTLMWSDGASTHAVLSGTTTRASHIAAILKIVEKGKYDGIDIDYEGKMAETKDFYSLFLKELKAKLGKRTLSCTIEARTPPASLYKEIPNPLRYANDYVEIAKWCDRVNIMAYDQQRADLLLNKSKNGQPYMPVSDVDWVRKVVELAVKTIPPEKIHLGIATYGHHYAVTVAPDWFKNYARIGALNVPTILEVAKEQKVTPTRNKAGEMSFTYLPEGEGSVKLPTSSKYTKGIPKGHWVAARALAYANKTGKEVTFNLGWYSDAGAILQKADLAKEYGLAGISLFKIDGEEDQKIWKEL